MTNRKRNPVSSIKELVDSGALYCTRQELARALHVSVRTVDVMISTHEIPVVRFRKAVRFRIEDVGRRFGQAMRAESEEQGAAISGQKSDLSNKPHP